MLAVNIGNEQILAFCAVATLALGISLAVNSRLKDRGDRQERARDEDEAEDERYRLLREFIISQINTVRVDLDNLTVALFGRPQDPARGIPGVEGFTQRQEHHNHLVDEELRTVNGGGTLKGALSKLQTDFGTLQHSVTALESSTVRIGTQLHDLTEEVAAQGRDSSP